MAPTNQELQLAVDQCWNEASGVKFLFARDLMQPFGYARWESFEKVVLKAAENVRTVGEAHEDHIRQATKMVQLGSGAERELQDYMLSDYGAYMVALNADSSKPEIAYLKSYFAEQTRKQEQIERRAQEVERVEGRELLKSNEKALSKLFFERGLDGRQVANVRSKGDAALFGAPTRELKTRFRVTGSRPLADFLPTLGIAAKNFANELTRQNVEYSDMEGEAAITAEHVGNSRSVRQVMIDRGITPEELEPAEDVAKVKRRLDASEKKLAKKALPPVE